MVIELRRYTINRGKMDSWLEFFPEAVRQNELRGIKIVGSWVNEDRSQFIWMRAFADEDDRTRRKADLYSSDWWRSVEELVMEHLARWDVEALTPMTTPERSLESAASRMTGHY